MGDVEDSGSLFNTLFDFFLGGLPQLQAERHVLKNGHVRIQSVVLEHHGDIAVLRGNIIYQTVADVQLAFGNLFQAGDHTQRGRFTAAGRTNQNDEFLIRDFQSKVGYSRNSAGISFVDVFQGKTCHKVYLLHFAVSGMQPPLWGVSGTERFSIIYNTKLQPTWEDYLYPNFKKTVYVL